MMVRHCDNPALIRADSLRFREICAQPGRWLGQPKLNGRRRCAWNDAGRWEWYSKGDSEGSGEPVPAHLRHLLERQLRPGCGVDLEWMGPRQKGGRHFLYVFDMLACDGEWLGDMGFAIRVKYLDFLPEYHPGIYQELCRAPVFDKYLAQEFDAQKADPLSEGLVIRRYDSVLVGGLTAPKVNPLWYKVKFRG